MANTNQDPDLEGLHREIHSMTEQMRVMNENNARLIQLLATTNPPPPVVPPILGIERSHRSHRSGDNHSQNYNTGQEQRGQHHSTSPSRHACLDAINTGEGVPVTVDTLIRQTGPPFTEMILRTRVSSRFKLPTQLGIYEGKTNPMNHLDSYKSLMSLQGCPDAVICKAFSATLKGSIRSWFRKLPPATIDSFGDLSRLFVANFMSCRIRQKNASHLFTVHQKEIESLKDYLKQFNQAILEVEDPSDKVVIMAMMEGLRPGPLFNSLSKNVPETLSTLQNKADKYIAAEELAEAKQDNFQLKEQISNLIKKGYLRKYVADCPPPNSPERRYGNNRPTTGDIQVIHGVIRSGRCTSSSRKRHVRNAHNRAEEEIYNLSSPFVDTHLPITFNNDDLKGLHLPHDDALVVSAVITNFNIQRILVDNGSSADMLFVSAFDKMKIELDKLHPFHTPLVGFGGNMTHPLGWIKFPVTLGMEPHQTTI
ncbi:hypothetical protein Acr_07g0012710 [Actinidia rufa]|uniref:Retrotransposon gag domain-containing protein n=1 Tax=Actinidia rufa TaxID=165716 RepID=A0A7J0EX86_9ERIC|nr:hypothetical protein Acr_07g0012710 [Actinidia rufa]